MEKQTYNGWSNYATWRIKLEVFDDNSNLEKDQFNSIDDFREYLENELEEVLTNYGEIKEPCLAVDYARAFCEDVNFYEIAKSIAEDKPEIIKNK